jgi:hypothetical protein
MVPPIARTRLAGTRPRRFGYAVAFAVWALGGLVVFTLAYSLQVDRNSAAEDFARTSATQPLSLHLPAGDETLWLESGSSPKPGKPELQASRVRDSVSMTDASGRPIPTKPSSTGEYRANVGSTTVKGEPLVDFSLPAPAVVAVDLTQGLGAGQNIAGGPTPSSPPLWPIVVTGLGFIVAAIVIARSTGRRRARRTRSQSVVEIDPQ